MRTQEAIAQAVKGTNPHTAHIDWQHRAQSREHFFGSFIGKRHRHHATGRDLPGLHEPGDSRGQHAGLTRASTRQN